MSLLGVINDKEKKRKNHSWISWNLQPEMVWNTFLPEVSLYLQGLSISFIITLSVCRSKRRSNLFKYPLCKVKIQNQCFLTPGNNIIVQHNSKVLFHIWLQSNQISPLVEYTDDYVYHCHDGSYKSFQNAQIHWAKLEKQLQTLMLCSHN